MAMGAALWFVKCQEIDGNSKKIWHFIVPIAWNLKLKELSFTWWQTMMLLDIHDGMYNIQIMGRNYSF